VAAKPAAIYLSNTVKIRQPGRFAVNIARGVKNNFSRVKSIRAGSCRKNLAMWHSPC